MLLVEILEFPLLSGAQPICRAYVFPSLDHLEIVRSAWVSLERAELPVQRDGAIPGGGAAGSVLKHIGLCSNGLVARSPIADPAEIQAGKVARQAWRFCRGMRAGGL